jgi:hypothetical protein
MYKLLACPLHQTQMYMVGFDASSMSHLWDQLNNLWQALRQCLCMSHEEHYQKIQKYL